MSDDSTNTPNGDSKKDLYSQNNDNVELTYIDCNAIGKEDLAKWQQPGDGIEVDESKIVEVSDSIQMFGMVRIGTTLVGQPLRYGPEAKTDITLAVEDVKRAMQAKGALTAEDYINLKREKTERKEKAQEELEEEGKNNDIRS